MIPKTLIWRFSLVWSYLDETLITQSRPSINSITLHIIIMIIESKLITEIYNFFNSLHLYMQK